MSKLAIIGGGAAGMAAGIAAGKAGHQIDIYEKNEKLGKKLFITGKGRCNITNASDLEEIFSNIVRNPKFLYSAIYGFDNNAVIDFFNSNGCPTKIERGNRIFPISDHSSDVIATLENALRQLGVHIHLNTPVEAIGTENGRAASVTVRGKKIQYDTIIMATGGFSYQTTGSDGDGYKFAESLGHSVTQIRPSLVPFTVKEAYVTDLQGVSLKNIEITISNKKKELFRDFGEMLFTHYGISGPLLLSASAVINGEIAKGPLAMTIDLKPAITVDTLDKRILREFDDSKNKQFKNAVAGLFPSKMIPVMIALSQIPPEQKVNEISKTQREFFLRCIKAMPLTLTGFRGFNEAIITRGGVNVKEINPSTMESKLVSGLYFAGELIDVDAMTGGYNLQIAWSTGVLAGRSIK